MKKIIMFSAILLCSCALNPKTSINEDNAQINIPLTEKVKNNLLRINQSLYGLSLLAGAFL